MTSQVPIDAASESLSDEIQFSHLKINHNNNKILQPAVELSWMSQQNDLFLCQ